MLSDRSLLYKQSQDDSSDDGDDDYWKIQPGLAPAETQDKSSPHLLGKLPLPSSGHQGNEKDHTEFLTSKEIEERISRCWEDRAAEWLDDQGGPGVV